MIGEDYLLTDPSSRACRWPEPAVTMTFEYQQSAILKASSEASRLLFQLALRRTAKSERSSQATTWSSAWVGRGDFAGMQDGLISTGH